MLAVKHVINVSMGFAGAFTSETFSLYAVGLPFLLAGSGVVSSCTTRSMMRPSADRSCCCY
jgi:hypothetical protein